jgi:hypothetical protein
LLAAQALLRYPGYVCSTLGGGVVVDDGIVPNCCGATFTDESIILLLLTLFIAVLLRYVPLPLLLPLLLR